jgi:hypothetical protein
MERIERGNRNSIGLNPAQNGGIRRRRRGRIIEADDERAVGIGVNARGDPGRRIGEDLVFGLWQSGDEGSVSFDADREDVPFHFALTSRGEANRFDWMVLRIGHAAANGNGVAAENHRHWRGFSTMHFDDTGIARGR